MTARESGAESLEVDVTAAIKNATVTSAGGDVTVKALTAGTINAWAVGVSGALSTGSGGGIAGSGFSFVGAGSFATNRVIRRNLATVRGNAAVTAKTLTVNAEDRKSTRLNSSH